jgi:cytochrome subunit of sulfide dehydrogenase
MTPLQHLAHSIAACAAAVVAHGAAAQTTPSEGRLLASNCFQCHGMTGRGGFEEIAGKSRTEIYSKLKEMQRIQPGSGDHNIMIPHAKGYTDAQLRKISEYFAQIR